LYVFDCRDGVDNVFILLNATLCRIPEEQRLMQRSLFMKLVRDDYFIVSKLHSNFYKNDCYKDCI
jgi:hypothetical protein